MKYEEFAASFPNPETATRCGDQVGEIPGGEVVLAGAIVSATKDSCCIDINGVRYEIDPNDVIDLEVLPRAGEGERAADAGETAAAKPPDVTLVKATRNAVLWRRVPAPAALVAAMGTWVNVVPVAADAA
ncbi:MAG: hypothetical protein WA418_35390 [Bradyrhizobium sp.]